MFNDRYREAVDAHIKALKEAHEREINALDDAYEREGNAMRRAMDILAEQVDYLRAQLAQRPHFAPSPSTPALNPTNQPLMVEGFPPYVSEQEAELRQLFEEGHMDQDELESALQTLGFGN